MNIQDVDYEVKCEFNFDRPGEPPCHHKASVVDSDVRINDVSKPRFYCEEHRPDKKEVSILLSETTD